MCQAIHSLAPWRYDELDEGGREMELYTAGTGNGQRAAINSAAPLC
jgi:hypothetical protein